MEAYYTAGIAPWIESYLPNSQAFTTNPLAIGRGSQPGNTSLQLPRSLKISLGWRNRSSGNSINHLCDTFHSQGFTSADQRGPSDWPPISPPWQSRQAPIQICPYCDRCHILLQGCWAPDQKRAQEVADALAHIYGRSPLKWPILLQVNPRHEFRGKMTQLLWKHGDNVHHGHVDVYWDQGTLEHFNQTLPWMARPHSRLASGLKTL